jgi:hypothetical protein
MAKNPLMDAIRRLKIQNGDVVVLATGSVSREGLNELSERLAKMGKTDILLMVLEKPEDIRVMNETEMNKYGWFRARAVIPLKHKADDGDRKEKTNEPIRINHRT